MKDSLLLELAQALSEGLVRRTLLDGVAHRHRLVDRRLAARLMRPEGCRSFARCARTRGRAPDALQFSIDGVRRLMFPVTAQIVLWLGEGVLRLTGILHEPGDERLLRLAMTLLGAMAVVRLVVYVCDVVFSGWRGSSVRVGWPLSVLEIAERHGEPD